jgi:hypothetical protein
MGSQKNVAEVVRRKSDGALYEVLYVTRQHAAIAGHKFVRMGPAGQPRSKRRWVPIDVSRTEYLQDIEA